jgi:hypothetical protein
MSETDSLSSADSLTYAIPAAILVFLVSFSLFQWEYLWPFFRVVLWLGIPLVVYLLTSVTTLLAQYSGCGTVRIGDVFLYSVPSAVFSWIALLVSYFSWFRLPIASAVGPLFVETRPSSNSRSCCGPSMTLETMELQAPMIKGFSYGFYLFFSTIFGLLVSIGFAGIC